VTRREERSRTPEPGVRTSSSGRTAVTVRPMTTPPPTQSEKVAAALPFPPPWSPSCDASMALRRAALKSCLGAGLRAAGLPLHDGVKLLGKPYPCSSPSSCDKTSTCVSGFDPCWNVCRIDVGCRASLRPATPSRTTSYRLDAPCDHA
jgi:hypothetical protein